MRSVAFAPDSRTIVSGQWLMDGANSELSFGTGGMSGSISVISEATIRDVDGGKLRQTLSGHDRRRLRLPPTAPAWTTVAFSPDGNMVASGASDKMIILWDVKTGQPIRKLQGHEETVISIAFSPDGAQLASGSADATVRLWNVQTGEPQQSLKGHASLVTSVAYSPDGKTIATASGQNVRLWRVK